MIESVVLSAPLGFVGDPYLWASQKSARPDQHKRGTKGSVWWDSLGGSKVALRVVGVGPAKGRVDVVVKANLPRLLDGDRGKAGTLRPERVPDGLVAALESATYCLGSSVTPALVTWRPERVDSNATLPIPGEYSRLWIDGVGEVMRQSKGEWSAGGRTSYLLRETRQREIACYSKSVESGILAPGGEDLVRLEVRDFGAESRKAYGETIVDMIERGPSVGRERVSTWLDRLGRHIDAEPSRVVVDRLIERGMDPSDAFRLAGPALIAAAEGIEGLTRRGIDQRKAYRWVAEIRAYAKDPDAFLDPSGLQYTTDDIVWSDELVESSTA